MLRDRRDTRTLVHSALSTLAMGATLFHSLAWWPAWAFLAVHLVAAQHNHAHRPIFTTRSANLVFDHASALLCGIPLSCWRIHHLRSHHVAPWTDGDWSSPYRFADRTKADRPVSYRFYQTTYLFLFWSDTAAWLRSHGGPERWRALGEVAGLGAASVLLAWLAGPWRWAGATTACYLTCGFALGAVNYMQHWNSWLPARGEFGAWTFTHRLHNILNYNAGYHMLHHEQPHLHWADLPVVHRADPSYAPAHLIETGVFPAYLASRRRRHWLATH